MAYGHIALAILVSGFLASLTDWFFGGVLFHKQYMDHPEIWRMQPGDKGAEGKAVLWSVVLGFVTCAAFVFACLHFNIHAYAPAICLAVFVWVIAPVPLLITNALFIKMHPLNVVAHALGWLAKLLLAALAVGWLGS